MITGVVYLYRYPDGKVYVGYTKLHLWIKDRTFLDDQLRSVNEKALKGCELTSKPTYEVLDTIETIVEDELESMLIERRDYYVDQYQASDPQHGYNNSEKIIAQLCENLYEQYSEILMPEYQGAAKKTEKLETMTEMERAIYKAYFELHPLCGIQPDEVPFYYFWFSGTERMISDDMRVLAEELVFDNLPALLEQH